MKNVKVWKYREMVFFYEDWKMVNKDTAAWARKQGERERRRTREGEGKHAALREHDLEVAGGRSTENNLTCEKIGKESMRFLVWLGTKNDKEGNRIDVEFLRNRESEHE